MLLSLHKKCDSVNQTPLIFQPFLQHSVFACFLANLQFFSWQRYTSKQAASIHFFFYAFWLSEVFTVSHSTSNKSNLNFLIVPLCLLQLRVGNIRVIILCKFPHNSSFITFPSFFSPSLPHFSLLFPLIPLSLSLSHTHTHTLSLSYDHEQFIKNVCLWGEVCSWVLEDFLTSNEIAKQNYL